MNFNDNFLLIHETDLYNVYSSKYKSITLFSLYNNKPLIVVHFNELWIIKTSNNTFLGNLLRHKLISFTISNITNAPIYFVIYKFINSCYTILNEINIIKPNDNVVIPYVSTLCEKLIFTFIPNHSLTTEFSNIICDVNRFLFQKKDVYIADAENADDTEDTDFGEIDSNSADEYDFDFEITLDEFDYYNLYKCELTFALNMEAADPKRINTLDICDPVVQYNDYREKKCCICFRKNPNITFYPCHHSCVHLKCYQNMNNCPLCRKYIMYTY